MKSVFKTQNAFWAAESKQANPQVPKGKMWLSTLRLEIVEIGDDVDMEIEFTILAGLPVDMSPNDAEKVKSMLRTLREHLNSNYEHFK